jgi:hypothetical protein
MKSSLASAAVPLAALLLSSAIRPSHAQEYLRDETVAPESADEIAGSAIDIAEPERVRRPIRRLLQDSGPLWRDSQFDFDLRGYDFVREDELSTLSEAFAIGGELSFRSGRYKDRLSFGASWFTSQGVDAPADKDGTGLLGSGQTDISVLGKAYVRVDFSGLLTRLYRQDFDLPYLNREDSRMIPNTHEAYILARSDDEQGPDFLVGHVTRMKTRTSERFIDMGQIAGVDGSSAGTSILGLRLRPRQSLELSGMALLTHDIFDTVYVEASWRREMTDDWAMNVAAQYSDQESTGKSLVGVFSTNSKGVRAAISYRNGIVTLARTETAGGAAIRSPFGGRPGFNSLMLFDFDRAGERATRLGVSYNFRRAGVPSLSLEINRALGKGAIDSATSLRLPDENETDLTIDYRPTSGPLGGLWVRYRIANGGRGSPTADRSDRRLILNYELPLF